MFVSRDKELARQRPFPLWPLSLRSQPDKGIKDPLINLSNKLQRGFCPQGNKPVTSTYSNQGSHVPHPRHSCLLQKKSANLYTICLAMYPCSFGGQTFLHHQLAWKNKIQGSWPLRWVHIAKPAEPSKCCRKEGNEVVEWIVYWLLLNKGKGKPYAVYGEWALEVTCLRGWMVRLLVWSYHCMRSVYFCYIAFD